MIIWRVILDNYSKAKSTHSRTELQDQKMPSKRESRRIKKRIQKHLTPKVIDIDNFDINKLSFDNNWKQVKPGLLYQEIFYSGGPLIVQFSGRVDESFRKLRPVNYPSSHPSNPME